MLFRSLDDLRAHVFELKDEFENMGAQIIKEVSTKTNDVAGDGTTTAVVLAQAIIKEGSKNVAAGANPIILKRGIDKAVDVCVEKLRKEIAADTPPLFSAVKKEDRKMLKPASRKAKEKRWKACRVNSQSVAS